MLIHALLHQFLAFGRRTGADIIATATDADLLALLALAGDETADGLDQMYAEILVCDPKLRISVEQARLRNCRPLEVTAK